MAWNPNQHRTEDDYDIERLEEDGPPTEEEFQLLNENEDVWVSDEDVYGSCYNCSAPLRPGEYYDAVCYRCQERGL